MPKLPLSRRYLGANICISVYFNFHISLPFAVAIQSRSFVTEDSNLSSRRNAQFVPNTLTSITKLKMKYCQNTSCLIDIFEQRIAEVNLVIFCKVTSHMPHITVQAIKIFTACLIFMFWLSFKRKK